MDEYSSRKTSGGLVVSRKGPNFLRDSPDNRDRNVHVCSRAGCSSRLNQMKNTEIGSPSKPKTPRTPFRSEHGKQIVGSSSRSTPSVITSRKSFFGSKKKISFNLETMSDNSSGQDESTETSDSTPKSGDTKSVENKPACRKTQKLGVSRQEPSSGFPVSFPFKQTGVGSTNGAGTSRYNLRNLRCNSNSDIVPSGRSSPPESSSGRKRVVEPKRSPTVREKKNGNFGTGVFISDSRPTRNSNVSEDNDATSSVRNPRYSTVRTRLSNQENRNRLPLVESPLLLTQSSPDTSSDANASSSDGQFLGQTPSYSLGSFGRPGSSSSEHLQPNRSIGSYGAGISRSFMNRDALRQYGIAEMLLALDRIEQDDEPCYEQLLVLETNLFLGGLGLHDQHREMRLDIDNMSYEELLALGERIGTVSTAVPEEVLTKCLQRGIYQQTTDSKKDEDDFKCSICQEEYNDGDEVGRLGCDHRYHMDCINQWLSLKNWCPICKVSATSSPPPS
ncbi:hypothetical protein RND81_10G174900 [Saponaria officinalis]|uniref:RING-type E3 ubiquitin transferase n=1 Tax=Saponaria officinalis TaxID=3572 RepID=A0AAW1I5P7_SAPOF